MADLSDSQLLIKARNGDIQSFKAIVDRKEGRVAEIVLSVLGETSKAEDIGQEVFIRLYDSLDKIGEKNSIDTYLGKLAAKLTLYELSKGRDVSSRNSRVQNSKTGRPRKDFNEHFAVEFSTLDPELQLVLTLRIIIGYSIEDTADILAIPVATVVSRLGLAQHQLRASLSKVLDHGT